MRVEQDLQFGIRGIGLCRPCVRLRTDRAGTPSVVANSQHRSAQIGSIVIAAARDVLLSGVRRCGRWRVERREERLLRDPNVRGEDGQNPARHAIEPSVQRRDRSAQAEGLCERRVGATRRVSVHFEEFGVARDAITVARIRISYKSEVADGCLVCRRQTKEVGGARSQRGHFGLGRR